MKPTAPQIARLIFLVAAFSATPVEAKCGMKCVVGGAAVEYGIDKAIEAWKLLRKQFNDRSKRRPGLCRPADICNDPAIPCRELPGGAKDCGAGFTATDIISQHSPG
jgi:hypothetical protein